ncbi:hypothetical protein G7Y89_g3238 [Cudoniella acicularis]|uniref:Major facilitator superfamily (MFS) profile domain-containing protein n=1 Tax=Cudoniella acicularis TaxID=354080 RepID=A0A8H4RTT8_9HELO|nr:hypothetical protein G7Y89_g3238 [Cudoniella acicularis]
MAAIDTKSSGVEKVTNTPALDAEIGMSKVINGNGDKALDFLNTEEKPEPLSPEAQKALVRKIDWMLIPILGVIYMLNYLDKVLLNFSAVMNIRDDANITTEQFAQLALVFYVAFLFCEFPHGWLIQRLPTGKYLGGMVTLWGIAVTMTCTITNYPGLVATRVLLGMFESAMAPAMILITSMWYTRREQPFRSGLWYCGAGVGGMIGALTSYGFQHYHSKEFKSWQIMFLVVGVVTIACGILTFLILPDNPMASRLTKEEKYHAIERVRENQTGIESKVFKKYQCFEALKDPQNWIFALMFSAIQISAGAISSFQAIIISGFGWDSKTSALLQLPGAVLSILASLSGSWLAANYNQRCFSILTLLIPGFIGNCLMAFAPASQGGARLAGVYLANITGSSIPLVYSWIGSNVAGHSKKVTSNAMLLMAYSLGNILGPLSFRNGDAPDYLPAKLAMVVTSVFAMCMCLTLRGYYMWQNRRRDNAASQVETTDNFEFSDLTDRENMMFRYRL